MIIKDDEEKPMSITNKEIIDKLQAYYLKQDPKEVARVLAALTIDISRFATFNDLDDEAKASLIYRTNLNHNQLVKFIKDGDEKPMKYTKWDEL